MADETKPEATAQPVAPGSGEAASGGAPSKPAAPSAPAAAANPAAAPHAAPKPAAAPRPPAAPPPDLGGRTTNVASPGGAAAVKAAIPAAKPAAAAAAGRDPDDSSPLLSRRAWMGLAWGAFSAASAAALAATGRFMFPNVLNEPPQQFKAGFPNEYGIGVDERWKEKFGIWIVKIADENVEPHGSGFYALITVCTHLGCTPNYLSAENKFKCPCHGSGYRLTGINFEGPAPRPLERARIVLSDDGQILVDKSKHYQYELGQWTDPEAFLKA
ncbi:MAG TPA: Rieske 2Fe-2S domain-containing protein [Vicinamibacterales bacterium]|jgi:cytochrome b6-f complex iron-sulfur subunit|nr:Rieske 2Fe-2S domain-containing protein [Vicinamibacterales bacterium]